MNVRLNNLLPLLQTFLGLQLNTVPQPSGEHTIKAPPSHFLMLCGDGPFLCIQAERLPTRHMSTSIRHEPFATILSTALCYYWWDCACNTLADQNYQVQFKWCWFRLEWFPFDLWHFHNCLELSLSGIMGEVLDTCSPWPLTFNTVCCNPGNIVPSNPYTICLAPHSDSLLPMHSDRW